ncbi:glycosyltransferase family 39 protein [Coleofasciculus sp. E1-EBD-02]|uniref:glycosyltransferase family 39 protein n=1 Tax=Coleofasciculus sp. E1-EBD-02 TaxID=3068481 RepID=UPI0033024DEF
MKEIRHQVIIACVAITIILGLFFRFANLGKKVYWTDEIYTSVRVSGHTIQEYSQDNFNGDIIQVKALQDYLQPRPQNGLSDTMKALVNKSEHPPLYYLMAHFWVRWFGNTPPVTRSLSALISLLVFPAIYWLCWELFESPITGWVVVSLIAVSPVHILYAQEARQYSLWTVTILLSCAALFRAMRMKTPVNWGIYALTLSLALYSHLLSFLVLIAQAIYVAAMNRWRLTQQLKAYLFALTGAIVVFLPWFVLIREVRATGWTSKDIPLWVLFKRWMFNLTAVFFDPQISYDKQLFDIRYGVDNGLFGLNYPLTYLVIPILLLVAYAIYFLIRTTPKRVWLFVLILISITALPLALPDLLGRGQRSTIARYLIPSFVGIQLAVAYLLSVKITPSFAKAGQQKLWQVGTVILISLGILSSAVSSQSETWWNKYTNYYDPQVARIVNQSPTPLVISSSVVRTTSLSYWLNPEIQLMVIEAPPLPDNLNQFSDVFLFQPTNDLRAELEQQSPYQIKPVYELGWLWQILSPN